jgi:hypothetical protein
LGSDDVDVDEAACALVLSAPLRGFAEWPFEKQPLNVATFIKPYDL